MIDNLICYQVDPARGFLPKEDPLESLPSGFEVWESIAAKVPTLLTTSNLRTTLEKLTPLDISKLENERQLGRAMLLLGVFGNAYVWGGEKPATIIPRGIALPWWEVSKKLGHPPIASYASLVLDNWRRLNKSKPVELDNIATLQLFTGSLDEQWFYLTSVAMEATGGVALASVVKAQEAVVSGRVEILAEQLKKIASVLAQMYGILVRIPEKCDPYTYYHYVRPFLAGWPEQGVIYEGVSDIPQKFVGGSAAQSSLVQSLDAGLGIRHQDSKTQFFLYEMRSYMPPSHRKFIETLEAKFSVRQFLLNHKQTYPTLCNLYNDCIQHLNTFRKKHMEIAALYILRQNPLEAKGTGGTNFVHFLKKVEQETKVNLII